MERRVLGKGLEALIPKKTQDILHNGLSQLDIEKIVPAHRQPRQSIDNSEIAELAASIKEKGVIQPIVVRNIGAGRYEIVAGERRYLACKSLGMKEIPTLIKEIDEREAFVVAMIENLQRKDLNPVEEAQAFSRLIGELAFSLSEIAQLVGKEKSTIVNSLRLLKLPEVIQKALREGVISRSHARSILAVESASGQEELFRQIISAKMTVREIEKKTRAVVRRRPGTDPFVAEAQEHLQKALGTKVRIYNNRKNRGRIVIEYYTLKDLERIIKKAK